MDNLILKCPHCNDYVLIYKKEFNCKIFRHAYYRDSYKQIDPHMKKDICIKLLKEDLIYGCGKPFKLIEHNNEYILEKCDYI
tara:strand:- start:736 stop:981 length:246 start_codon:yes stop_codon:yes gene_type:complete